MLKLQASATLGASLLGTGILAQPKACESTGLIPFVFLTAAALLISHLSAMFLCRTSIFLNSLGSPQKSMGYSDVVAFVFGRKGELGIMWTIAIMQIGCCVGYIVVIGDVFTPLIAHWTHSSQTPSSTVVIFTFATFIILPLTVFVRDLSSFKYTSAAAVLVVMFFAFVVVGNGIFVLSSSDPDEKREELIGQEADDLEDPQLWPREIGALRAIPLVCFAYFMHFNVLPVVKTLKALGPAGSEAAYETASRMSFLLSGGVSGAFGVFGYLTFLSAIESDILSNFFVSETYISSFMNVVRAMYGLGLMLAFPIVLWEARENLKGIIYGTDSTPSLNVPLLGEEGSEEDVEIVSPRVNNKDSFRVHAGFSIALIFLTALLGSVVTDLSVVFGLVGSTCTPVIAYALPAAVYLKSGAAAKYSDETKPRICLFLGLSLIPFGVAVWVLDRMGRL
jgi:amino acid permease